MVLGQAAAEADHERPGELEEAAAAEMELGGQALRAMWRWTCHQVWSLHARCECPVCTLLLMPCSAHQEAKLRQGITSLARPFGTLQWQLICPISGSVGRRDCPQHCQVCMSVTGACSAECALCPHNAALAWLLACFQLSDQGVGKAVNRSARTGRCALGGNASCSSRTSS